MENALTSSRFPTSRLTGDPRREVYKDIFTPLLIYAWLFTSIRVALHVYS